MKTLRAIPRRLLPDTATVRHRNVDGTFARGVRVRHVRFEYTQALSTDVHRLADAGAGTLFIDAVNSEPATEPHAGDRVDIDGHSYTVTNVARLCGMGGRIHHWEVGLS